MYIFSSFSKNIRKINVSIFHTYNYAAGKFGVHEGVVNFWLSWMYIEQFCNSLPFVSLSNITDSVMGQFVGGDNYFRCFLFYLFIFVMKLR